MEKVDQRALELFDIVCPLMLGEYDREAFYSALNEKVADEFHGGACDILNERAYLLREKLARRLRSTVEDEDLLALIRAYEDMILCLCRKSFLYGWELGREDLNQ